MKTIIEAIKDERLFRPFFTPSLKSWRPWMTALRVLYGLPVKRAGFVKECTGRAIGELPGEGFKTALFLVGRRSGKSRISAVIGVFEALFAGHEEKLAKGETGIIPIIAPTRYQAGIVWKYIKAAFEEVELFKDEVVDLKDQEKTLQLRNGIEIRVMVGDFRSVRGPTVVCAIVDEVCFFGVTEESRVRSDTELIRALRPALATTQGKLICISSKYARKGWAYHQWKRHHGSNADSAQYARKWHCLVWDTPSRTMNPTLSEDYIRREFEEDPASARSEFGGEWREDVAEFVPRSMVESLVVPGRKELMPRSSKVYTAFADLSGGRSDDASLAIGHKVNMVGDDETRVVLDFVKAWRAPFNPHVVIGEMVEEVKRYGIKKVTGDNYSAEFTKSGFEAHGINYEKSAKPKAELYRELLPVLCSGGIELLDNPRIVEQLAALERKTRSGGKDIIDHPKGGKDDIANAVAGVAVQSSKRVLRVGAF